MFKVHTRLKSEDYPERVAVVKQGPPLCLGPRTSSLHALGSGGSRARDAGLFK